MTQHLGAPVSLSIKCSLTSITQSCFEDQESTHYTKYSLLELFPQRNQKPFSLQTYTHTQIYKHLPGVSGEGWHGSYNKEKMTAETQGPVCLLGKDVHMNSSDSPITLYTRVLSHLHTDPTPPPSSAQHTGKPQEGNSFPGMPWELGQPG